MIQSKDIGLNTAEIKFHDTSAGMFEGYASMFGGLDSYKDTVVPGAYKGTLENRSSPILMLYGHNPGRVLGKWLDVREDEKGLKVTGEFTPGHTEAQNVHASLKHGALSGLSIGYKVPPGGAEEKDGVRLLKQIDLFEISVVSMPADDAARVSLDSVKSHIEEIETIRDLEVFLRDAGSLSRSAATALVSRCKSVFQGEPAELAKLVKERDELRAALMKARTEVLNAKYKLPI